MKCCVMFLLLLIVLVSGFGIETVLMLVDDFTGYKFYWMSNILSLVAIGWIVSITLIFIILIVEYVN